MELKFVGTGSAFSEDVNNSAYFIKNDNMFLIDCGETVFSTLKKSAILDQINNLYVFITHTHSDHIGSLSSLIHYMYYIKNKQVKIVTSENYEIEEDIKTLLRINGNVPEQFLFINKEIVKDVFQLQGIELSEVKHSQNLKSYAIKIQECKNGKNESLVFTGDTCDEDFITNCLQDKNLKKIYVDVSLYGGGHLSYEKAIELLSPFKDKVVFMHLENGFVFNRLNRQGFTCAERTIEMENEKCFDTLLR